MLHNKHFLILQEFLGDYTKEVYGRGLTGKIPLSQKSLALTLGELEKKGILISKEQGNMKYYKLNLRNSELRDFLACAEILKKIEFFSKNRKIAQVFGHDTRIIGIFGSHAKSRATAHSDIDVFIIGNKKKEKYEERGKNFDLNISTKYFSEEDFKKLMQNKNPLCKEIIESHILISGFEQFISLIWRHYYGFT